MPAGRGAARRRAHLAPGSGSARPRWRSCWPHWPAAVPRCSWRPTTRRCRCGRPRSSELGTSADGPPRRRTVGAGRADLPPRWPRRRSDADDWLPRGWHCRARPAPGEPARAIPAGLLADLRWDAGHRRCRDARQGVLLAARVLGVLADACTVGLAATAAWLIVRGVGAAVVRRPGGRRGRGARVRPRQGVSCATASASLRHDATFRLLGAVRGAVVGDDLARVVPAGLPQLSRGDLMARVVDDVDRLADLELRVVAPSVSAFIVGCSLLPPWPGSCPRPASCWPVLAVVGAVLLPGAASASPVGLAPTTSPTAPPSWRGNDGARRAPRRGRRWRCGAASSSWDRGRRSTGWKPRRAGGRRLGGSRGRRARWVCWPPPRSCCGRCRCVGADRPDDRRGGPRAARTSPSCCPVGQFGLAGRDGAAPRHSRSGPCSPRTDPVSEPRPGRRRLQPRPRGWSCARCTPGGPGRPNDALTAVDLERVPKGRSSRHRAERLGKVHARRGARPVRRADRRALPPGRRSGRERWVVTGSGRSCHGCRSRPGWPTPTSGRTCASPDPRQVTTSSGTHSIVCCSENGREPCPTVWTRCWARGTRASSGGQRQRIALARLLLADRRVVVLDEPTAQLDHATAGLVLGQMLDVARREVGRGARARAARHPPGLRCLTPGVGRGRGGVSPRRSGSNEWMTRRQHRGPSGVAAGDADAGVLDASLTPAGTPRPVTAAAACCPGSGRRPSRPPSSSGRRCCRW